MKRTLLLLLLFITACRPSPVNVSVLVPGNGSMDDVVRGIELATERINAEGGIYGHIVRVERVDDGKSVPKGSSAVIIATGDRKALDSAVDSARRFSVPVILVNPIGVTTSPDRGVVSFSRNYVDEASFLGDFCAFSLHASRVLIVEEDGSVASAFEKGFCREGETAETIKTAGVNPERLSELISASLSAKEPPQAVFWASSGVLPPQVSEVLSEKLGGRALFVTSAARVNFNGPLPEPALTALPYFDRGKKAVGIVEFSVNYRQKNSSAPSAWSAIGWEAINLVKQSFESGSKTSSEVEEFLKTREVNFTLLGKLNFNADCELMIPFDMGVVGKNGVSPLRELDRQVLVDLQEKVLAYRYGKKDGKTADAE